MKGKETQMSKEVFILLLALLVLAFITVNSLLKREEIVLRRGVIRSEEAPEAIGPYSQAIQVGNMLFCSGQIPIDPQTGELATGAIQKQTRIVLDNLGAVLREADMNYSDVVKVTLFLSDLDDYDEVNETYARYFRENPPAREAVQVAGLPKGVGVEISMVAMKTE